MKGKPATAENAQTGGESGRDFRGGLWCSPMGESREVWVQKLIPFFVKLWLHPIFLVISIGII